MKNDLSAINGLRFRCPGCGDWHMVPVGDGGGPRWGWNGSVEAPTFTPSILVRTGHHVPGHQGDQCWCNWPDKDEFPDLKCYVCHSFVTDGRIQFLGDCTHALAGQTVDLPEIEK
ncbi:ammonia monooxygenase [Rhizorhabdus wittichii DC-6]|nr:ammonia monooxygenase [Rhizorhabdus wittichii DC-6]